MAWALAATDAPLPPPVSLTLLESNESTVTLEVTTPTIGTGKYVLDLKTDDPSSHSCGPPPNATNPATPNVLIVGDAVSAFGSGYLHQLQRLLSPGLATVQHVTSPPAGGRLMTSAMALQCLSSMRARPACRRSRSSTSPSTRKRC